MQSATLCTLHFAWFYTLSSFCFLLLSLLPLVSLFVSPVASWHLRSPHWTGLAWKKLCVFCISMRRTARISDTRIGRSLVELNLFLAKPQSGGIRITENSETSILNNSRWTKDAFLRFVCDIFCGVLHQSSSLKNHIRKQWHNAKSQMVQIDWFSHRFKNGRWWISTKCGTIYS